VLLTGHADLDSAVAAVNEGQIFRFLTKPCPAPLVVRALEAAAEQHRLVHAERELLEQTLAGSIQMLVDVLALANPVAFGRASRLKRLAAAVCEQRGIGERWHIEAAAQLSQIGCIALPPAVAEKVYYGRPLGPAEKEMVARMPATVDHLLGNIARFEPVREILAAQAWRYDGKEAPSRSVTGEHIPFGARVLKLVLAFDALETAGTPIDQILGALEADEGEYDPALRAALREAMGKRSPAADVRDLPLHGLRPGMVFLEDIRSPSGTLLVARGLTVTEGLLERLRNLPPGTVKEPIRLVVR
jgi:response regulator RpfG family c-di-GMP phosphodiesterase